MKTGYRGKTSFDQGTFYTPYVPLASMTMHSDWEKWFAWYPVKTVGGKRYWLCNIYRRTGIITREVQYGDVFDVLGNE